MGNVWIALGLTILAGLATAIGSGIVFFADELFRIGVFAALAIALHNVPEGISICMPIYYAREDGGGHFSTR